MLGAVTSDVHPLLSKICWGTLVEQFQDVKKVLWPTCALAMQCHQVCAYMKLCVTTLASYIYGNKLRTAPLVHFAACDRVHHLSSKYPCATHKPPS